jgi:hypothetical protein
MGKDSWQIAAGSGQKKLGTRHRGKRSEDRTQGKEVTDRRNLKLKRQKSTIYNLKSEIA